MSREPDGFDPQDPERRRRRSAKASKPTPTEPGEEYSTFRPNPAAPGPAKKSRKKSEASPYTSDSVAYEPPVRGPSWWERILFGKVSNGQLAQFCRQLAAYLNAGVDIIRSLSGLERQFKGTALGPILARMQVGIRRGETLEDVMTKEPQAFGPMFLSMIKVAEARGGVPETLKMLAHHYEARQRLIRQARSGLIYPAVVLVIAGAVVALISVFVLPAFAAILRELMRGRPLPLPSQFLMAFAAFVRVMGWWLIPAAVFGTPFLLIYLYKTSAGRQVMDRIALSIPVLGTLCRMLDMTRFARTLSVLLDAGIDIGGSIDLTADVLQMTPIQQAVRSARPQVIAGKDLSEVLSRSRQFTPDVIAVLESGEETGKTPESLAHLADDYDEQVAIMVANIGQLIKPLIIVVLGLIVLFIILAVMLPIIDLITTLAGGGAA
jgi:type IV pilus assembly protein PilC